MFSFSELVFFVHTVYKKRCDNKKTLKNVKNVTRIKKNVKNVFYIYALNDVFLRKYVSLGGQRYDYHLEEYAPTP